MSNGMAQMSELIRRARREQIADAARRVLGERGRLDVSVDEIAEAAGLSRSTVYNHFADRDEILRASLARGHELLMAALEERLRGVDDPLGRLETIFAVVLGAIDTNAGFYRLATSLAAARAPQSPTVNAEMMVVSAEVTELLAEELRAATGRGLVSGAERVESVTGFVSTQLAGLASARARQLDPVPPERVARESWRLILAGVGP